MLDQSFQLTYAYEFRVTPGSFGALRKQILLRMLIPGVIIFALLVWMVAGGGPSAWIIALIFPAIIGYSMYNAIKRQEKQFYSYRLTITPESVQREQEGLASITIPKQEITKILKSDSGAITIIGRNKLNAIIVYAQVERAGEFEQLLNVLAPIETRKQSGWQKLSMLFVLVVIGAVYGSFAFDNFWLSGLCLLAFIAMMLWSLIVIFTSSNVEKRVKYLAWIILLPMLSVLSMWLSRWKLW
jgi:hypothetical protein